MASNLIMPVSPAELIDKITILEIKRQFIKDSTKLKNVDLEYKLLLDVLINNVSGSEELDLLRSQLKEVNMKLWDIEDKIRDLEKNKVFDKKFIELARLVYFTNDKRSEIKKDINKLLNSEIVEEKSYSDY
ncbi:MAG: hypothetical protein CFH32_01471 [Alphaproteobacteria bacterium MarineAlpha9_Bin2]|nr:MAG: hypothetical protein CFH32_01471 [Alphaproteobacteria bacterium MarineAlpha9_Bin2]